MAIVFLSPPFDPRSLGRSIAQIAVSPLSGGSGELAGTSIDRLFYAQPHENWFATEAAVISGRLVAEARPQSWRYLLSVNNRGIGEIEAEVRPSDVQPIVMVHEGDAAQRTLEALMFAETLEDVSRRDYVVRFLRVPAIDFAALWLHRDDADLFIPVLGQYSNLELRRAYSEPELVAGLKDRAFAASQQAPQR